MRGTAQNFKPELTTWIYQSNRINIKWIGHTRRNVSDDRLDLSDKSDDGGPGGSIEPHGITAEKACFTSHFDLRVTSAEGSDD